MSSEELNEKTENYSGGIIQYNINGDDITVYFEEEPDIIKNIIEDDEFAFIYLKKAQDEGKLADKGLNPETPIVKFSRCQVNKELNDTTEPLESYRRKIKPEDLIVWGHKFKATNIDIKATYDLLQIRSRDDIMALFEDPTVKQIQIWEQIAKKLIDLGYNLGPQAAERCRQKFTNLRKSYYNYKKYLEQGQENILRKPLFMDEMEKFCKDKNYTPKKISFREKIDEIKVKEKNNTDLSQNDSFHDFLNDHNYLFVMKNEEKFLSDTENDCGSVSDSLDESSSNEIIKTMKDLHEKQIIFQQNLHQQLVNTIKENTEETRKLNNLLEDFIKGFSKKRKRIEDDD